MDGINTVAWFEVASDDPDNAQRFYGELFGWRFAADAESAAGGVDYRLITAPGREGPGGGLLNTEGRTPGHAVFVVAVADVAATCAEVERLGGKIEAKSLGEATSPDHAYLRDPAGNLFGVFAPATG
jgi:predicted enzyme related to lactoylglutathione lyase